MTVQMNGGKYGTITQSFITLSARLIFNHIFGVNAPN